MIFYVIAWISEKMLDIRVVVKLLLWSTEAGSWTLQQAVAVEAPGK